MHILKYILAVVYGAFLRFPDQSFIRRFLHPQLYSSNVNRAAIQRRRRETVEVVAHRRSKRKTPVNLTVEKLKHRLFVERLVAGARFVIRSIARLSDGGNSKSRGQFVEAW